MSNTFDVIVIGVGAMGSSACLHLARRGVNVLGLEQFGIPHSLGSSHGETRMIRLCYYEHPDYVPLLHRAYELWHDLEQESGEKLLHMTGGIYIGQERSEFIDGILRSAQQHGLPHERLDQDELRRRYPQFVAPPDHIGVFEPNAGFLLPERVVATNAALAMSRGAELHGHEPALDWTAGADGVSVRTAHGVYSAGKLIICGGTWSERIVGDLGVKLVVTRQVLGWVWPRTPSMFALGTLPVWAIENSDGSQHYGFPMLHPHISARPGFKIAHHFQGTPTTPQSIDRIAQPEDEQDFRPTLQRSIPEADGPLLSMAVCMYTNSPDSQFIIDRHPAHANVTIACGFSGHGFKFGSVVGEVLADLALDGHSKHPIDFLRLSRFT
jgi:sarcosine oxidase